MYLGIIPGDKFSIMPDIFRFWYGHLLCSKIKNPFIHPGTKGRSAVPPCLPSGKPMSLSLSQRPLDVALTGETRLRLLDRQIFTGDVCLIQAGRRVQLWRTFSRAP